MAKNKTVSLPIRKEGRVVRKSGSRKLYLDFSYFGKRIERSTGLYDTTENRDKAQDLLDRFMLDIKSGTFIFSKAFPGATEEEKAYFAKQEGRVYNPEPQRVLFGDYLEEWIKSDLSEMSHSTRIDYNSSLNPWIRPFFRHMTFFQMNSNAVNQFIKGMTHKQSEEDKREGKPPEPFSKKRVKNILSHLTRIWEKACADNRWNLQSPFPPPGKRSGKSKQNERPVHEVTAMEITEQNLRHNNQRELDADRLPLRFHEWEAVYQQLDPWSRPIAELMLLTGLIPSELAGISHGHVTKGYIHIRQVISRGMLYDSPKTPYRDRNIRITQRIDSTLKEIMSRSDENKPFMITRENGGHFHHKYFWNKWNRAVIAAGIDYRVPYCLRHTFTAWSLCAGVDLNRLVDLLGHSTKEMVYKVYGKYTEGLEEDKDKILAFLGEDFINPRPIKQNTPTFAKETAKVRDILLTTT
jgi:integrase